MVTRAWPWQHYLILEMKWGVREACRLSPQLPELVKSDSLEAAVLQAPGSCSKVETLGSYRTLSAPPGERLLR